MRLVLAGMAALGLLVAPLAAAQPASAQMEERDAVHVMTFVPAVGSGAPIATGTGWIRYGAAATAEVLGRAVSRGGETPMVESVDAPVLPPTAVTTSFGFRGLQPNTLYRVVAREGIDTGASGMPNLRTLCAFFSDGGGTGHCASEFYTTDRVGGVDLRIGEEDGIVALRVL